MLDDNRILRMFTLFILTICALLLAMMLFSCNAVTQAGAPTPVIRATLNFKVDGVVQYGTALLDKKQHYVIEVPMSLLLPNEPMNLFFSSCHRSFEVAGLQSKDVWKYDYYPVVGLEDTGSCLVFISILTKSGISNTAVIDFMGNETLPLRAWCSGNLFIKTGVVFCQARETLVQSVAFNEPVKMVAGANCRAMTETKTPNMYEYQSTLGLCVYAFKGLESGKYGRLTNRGFSKAKDE